MENEAFVAGRIEVLGKHTDYCGGRSIVCAIDRGFHFRFEPRRDAVLALTDQTSGETLEIPLSASAKDTESGWGVYPATVAARFALNFGTEMKSGVAVSFRSDLPPAAGLSSSSALITGVVCALASATGVGDSARFRSVVGDPLNFAEYLGCVENGSTFRELKGESGGVGTFGGSQDHAAIVCSRAGTLGRYSFVPLAREAEYDFPEDLCFVVAASGVVAEKTGVARMRYNRLSRLASEIVGLWSGAETSLAAIVAAHGVERIAAFVRESRSESGGAELERRLRQFYEESFEIIPEASEMLAAGNPRGIGGLVDRSHRNAAMLLGNQTPETNFLQRTAREIGAFAASAFGAGFGGSVYAIVDAAGADEFEREWKAAYLARFPEHAGRAEFFATRPAQSRGIIPAR